jgi:hypothetical protein
MTVYRANHVSILVLVLVASGMGQSDVKIDPRLAALSIGTVLEAGQISGSLAYSGDCYYDGASQDFPELRTPSKPDASPLQILHEMFADTGIRVTQDSDGTVRMFEAGTPRDLLDLKIRHISFTRPEPLSSPIEALRVVLGAPEVKALLAAKNIGPPRRGAYRMSIPLSLESPHISGDLKNVTVSQALDYVLKTYPGFWTYENCQAETGNRTVFFRFFPHVSPGVVKFP